MTQLAIGYKQASNGREEKTGGLRTHNGPFMVIGGPVSLPPDSIGTVQIQANAVQQRIGSYQSTPTWSTTTNSAWVITGVSAVFTTSGGSLRIEFNSTFQHSVAAGQFYVGIALDGGNPSLYWFLSGSGVANAPVLTAGIGYLDGVSAGAHTLNLVVYNLSPGTLAQMSIGLHTLYVTEQKR